MVTDLSAQRMFHRAFLTLAFEFLLNSHSDNATHRFGFDSRCYCLSAVEKRRVALPPDES